MGNKQIKLKLPDKNKENQQPGIKKIPKKKQKPTDKKARSLKERKVNFPKQENTRYYSQMRST